MMFRVALAGRRVIPSPGALTRFCRPVSSGVATGVAVCAEEGTMWGVAVGAQEATMMSMAHLGAGGCLAFWLGSQEAGSGSESPSQQPVVHTLGG